MNAQHHPAQLAEGAVRALCWGSTGTDLALISEAVTKHLGAVLELAVRSKTICLLAAHVHDNPVLELHRTATRFLDSVLRTNRHKTHVYRLTTLAITEVMRNAGVPAVVLGGMSVEHTLYGSTGARQVSDIDLLVAPEDTAPAEVALRDQGYQPGRRAGTWTRRTEDPIAPLIVLDLTTTPLHSGAGTVAAVLARHSDVTVPEDHRSLPVLAPADALDRTLARLGTRATLPDAKPRWALAADVIRHSRVAAPRSPQHADVLAGWTVLRSHWPLLPATPTRLPAEEQNR